MVCGTSRKEQKRFPVSMMITEYWTIWNAVVPKTITISLLVYVKTVNGVLYARTEESAVRLSLMI